MRIWCRYKATTSNLTNLPFTYRWWILRELSKLKAFWGIFLYISEDAGRKFCFRSGFCSLFTPTLLCSFPADKCLSDGNERNKVGVSDYRNSCANQNRVHFVVFPRLYVRRGAPATVWCETTDWFELLGSVNLWTKIIPDYVMVKILVPNSFNTPQMFTVPGISIVSWVFGSVLWSWFFVQFELLMGIVWFSYFLCIKYGLSFI